MAQIQFGTAGRFGLLKQSAFESINSDDTLFDYFPFLNCDYSPIEGRDVLPQEASSYALPRGEYKTGVLFGGGMDFIPRFDERIGWILEAAFGDCSSYADQTIAQVIADAGTTVNVNTHMFGFLSNDQFELPYLTTHRLLPHETAANQVGEISQDARVAQLRIDAPPAGIVSMRLDMLGRANPATVWDIDPGWLLPTFDDDEAFIPTACTGSVSLNVIGGAPAALTAQLAGATTFMLANNLLPPAQGRIIGSPHPMDFPNLSRTIVIQTTLFIEDYDLYMQSMSGAASPVVDAGWSCVPITGNVDIILSSQKLIGATSEYHMMRIRTVNDNISWAVRPLVLRPNQPVVMQAQGTLLNADVDQPIRCYIQNNFANYD